MRRDAIRRAGGGLCLTAAGLLVGWVPGAPAPAASAAAAPVSGWWQQPNQASGPIPVRAPADPSTPPDGIQVTTTAAGVVAIGAVRFPPAGSATDSLVTLRLASGTATSRSGDLVVHACPATNNWKPVQNGPWAARATYAETACITGKPSADGTSVTFTVPASAQRAGSVDLAIEALSSAPVTLAFSHPTPSDLVPVAPPPATPTVSPPAADATATAPAEAPQDTPVVAPDAAPSNGPGLGAPVAPVLPVSSPRSRPARGAITAPQAAFSPAAALAPPLNDSRATRIVAVALLLGIGLALFWFGGQPVRAPQMIGTLGGRMAPAAVVAGPAHQVRGIGRFARPRDPGQRPGR